MGAEIGELSLTTLGSGAAVVRFQEELERVLENILDLTTEATAKRSITLNISIKPTSERNQAEVTVASSAKLSPSVAVVTRAYFGRDKNTGRLVAAENNPRQLTLEELLEKRRSGVSPLVPANGTAKAGGE